jgi:hypothetical protein
LGRTGKGFIEKFLGYTKDITFKKPRNVEVRSMRISGVSEFYQRGSTGRPQLRGV